MALDVFTTAVLTRRSAGFENNTDVTDANDLNIFVNSANAEVFSSVVQRYTLPLSDNTNYSGSPAENLLIETATELAGGLALYRQYEGQGGDFSDMGIAKIKQAREVLKKIRLGTIRLLDTDGVELGQVSSGVSALDGFPNDASDTDTEPKVSINDVY